MITAQGYSKDQSIRPEGIVITFGKEMMQNNGGQKEMMKYFLEVMQREASVGHGKFPNTAQ